MLLQIDNLGKVAITIEEDYWSELKDYDKLTIVEQEGIFGTFVSRKPVPAGTPLTDRKYWIPFSSLKEEIVLRFNEVVNELRELETSVDDKEAEIYKAMASIVAGGVALKQSFGDAEDFGISQKVLTESRDNLQSQIDAIINDKATVSLSVSPTVSFVGEGKTVTVTAKTNTAATVIDIWMEDEQIAHGEGMQAVATAQIDANIATEVGYIAEFTIAGLKKRTSATHHVVDKIYYGSSASTPTEQKILDDFVYPTARRTPAGTYAVSVDNDRDKVYFAVPATMSISKATMSGFDFPLESPTNITINNVNYKLYSSSNTYDAGTLTIVIS